MNNEQIIKYLEKLITTKEELREDGFDKIQELASNFNDVVAIERTINIIKQLDDGIK